MSDNKAMFLVNQLNPILKKSTSYIRKLEMDPDNKDIKLINMFNACLARINYEGRTVIQVCYYIFYYLGGEYHV